MSTRIAMMCLLGLLVTDPLAEWKLFSPKDGGFQVKTPGVPKKTTQELKSRKGTTTVALWGIEKDGIAYMVGRTELPPDVLTEGPKKMLDEARDKGVRNSGGTLKEEKEIELDGNPGREILLDLPETRVRGGGIYRAKIYLVGHIHYQVITLSPKADVRPDEMTAFLNSFRLVRDKTERPSDGATKKKLRIIHLGRRLDSQHSR